MFRSSLLAGALTLVAAASTIYHRGVPASTPCSWLATEEPVAVSVRSVEAVEPPPTLAEVVARGHYQRYETPAGPLHVCTPSDYEAPSARLVVYVHGYFTRVDDAWTQHRLAEQFAASGLNAMFVACEAPPGPRDPVSWPSLQRLLETLNRGADLPLPKGDVVAIGHSAAYRTVDGWLAHPRLQTVVRFDAAYGDVDLYRGWMRASSSHQLVDLAEVTRPWAEAVHRQVPRSVFIPSSFGHMEMISDGAAMPAILRGL
jgi:hypothetical protein